MAKHTTYSTKDLVNVARTSYKHLFGLLRRHNIEPLDTMKLGSRTFVRWPVEAMDVVADWRYKLDLEKLEKMIEHDSQPEPQDNMYQLEESVVAELVAVPERIGSLITAVSKLQAEVTKLRDAIEAQRHPILQPAPVQPPKPNPPFYPQQPYPQTWPHTYTSFGMTHPHAQAAPKK